MASNFYNFAREEISSVPTFKDLDSHNEKITIERRHKSWKKHIDHMTLRVKSKRRQNGVAACVVPVECVLRHVTLVNFFSAAFCHFCKNDMVQTVAEKCLKFSYLLLEKC